MSFNNFRLECFTEEAYYKLLNAIPDNSKYYFGDEDWLNLYFGNEVAYSQKLPLIVNKFTPKYTPGRKSDPQKAKEDLENTKLLYDAFISLTPYDASNKFMWTYLCHADPECRAYIRDRWMQNTRENTIMTRFFVKSPGSLLNDNALSRLWWYGYLTYDPESSNHYELTEVLLTNQTICTDVMDTLNRMNPNRMRGVLLGIKDFKEQFPDYEGITNCFRECNKELNHYAAVTTMEFLDIEEIRDIVLNLMIKHK